MSEQRRTAVDREREGAMAGVGGVVIALLGWGLALPSVAVVGVVLGLAGLVMWGAGMARRD